MKVILILFLCCLAVTLADESREKINKYVDECEKELKISEDDKPDPAKEDCFKACAMKKLGNMKADGTLDIEFIVANGPKNADKVQHRKDLVAKNEECIKKAQGNTCTFAACIFDDNHYHY